MRAHQGRLHSGPGPGLEVHAASFIRERRMVLDAALLKRPSELRRILVHELFHFVWARLGNPARRQYLALLEAECAAGARGELGWSSEMRKHSLAGAPLNSRAWREYACESFCDTAAWLWARRASHREFTLKPRFKNARARWFSHLSSHRQGAFRI